MNYLNNNINNDTDTKWINLFEENLKKYTFLSPKKSINNNPNNKIIIKNMENDLEDEIIINVTDNNKKI